MTADIFFNGLRKVIVGGIMLIFAFVVTYVPQQYHTYKTVDTAEAFLGGIVLDPSNLVQNTLAVVADFSLDGIAWAIAKAMISSMMNSILAWINSGFKGSPAFVQDLDRFLLEAADNAAGKYLSELGGIGSFLCSPFKLDIQVALALEYQYIREDQPYEGCTLTGIIDNIEGFIGGDFAQGGWDDWVDITSNPAKYTPYGQLLTARTGLQAAITNAEGEQLLEADWGNGFMSAKVCEAIEGPSGPDENCVISKPGKWVQETLTFQTQAGTQILIEADEFNEIVGALIGQLANKAITGAAGLLGLSSGTGHTYSGYNGGSYVNALDRSATNAINTTGGVSAMNTAIQTQRDYNALALSYIPQLQFAANNSRKTAEQRQAASTALNEAIKVRDKTTADIPKIQEIVDEFDTLTTELDADGTGTERKNEIRQRHLELTADFYRLGVYTKEAKDLAEDIWKSVI
jgi:hypothetical protein